MSEIVANPLGKPLEFTPSPMPPLDLVLETPEVRLEPLSPDHASDLEAAFRNHDELWDYMPSGPFADLPAFTNWIKSRAGQRDPLFLAIIDKSAGRAVGFASFMRIAPKDGVIEVGGIAFSPALQGTRLATEAMYLMMQWAFTNGYRRYEWKCHSLNHPSRRAAQRLGFSYEGLFRNHMVIKGRNRDTAWFAIIEEDWPALDAAFKAWLSPANFDENGHQIQPLSVLTNPLLKTIDPGMI